MSLLNEVKHTVPPPQQPLFKMTLGDESYFIGQDLEQKWETGCGNSTEGGGGEIGKKRKYWRSIEM